MKRDACGRFQSLQVCTENTEGVFWGSGWQKRVTVVRMLLEVKEIEGFGEGIAIALPDK